MASRQHDQIQFVRTGDPATVADTVNAYPGQLGGVYTDDQGKQWQYVQGDSTMSVAPFPGAVLWWADKSKFKVTTAAAARGNRAGVAARLNKAGSELTIAPGSSQFFFVQKSGRAVVKTTDSVTAAPGNAGQYVIPSATAGKADVLGAGTAATYPQLGREQGWYNVAAREVNVDLEIVEGED